MTEIWVVEGDDGDESWTEAVFSTEELANRFVAKWEERATIDTFGMTVKKFALDSRVADEVVIVYNAIVDIATGTNWYETAWPCWRSTLSVYPINESELRPSIEAEIDASGEIHTIHRSSTPRNCSGRSTESAAAARKLAQNARKAWLESSAL